MNTKNLCIAAIVALVLASALRGFYGMAFLIGIGFVGGIAFQKLLDKYT